MNKHPFHKYADLFPMITEPEEWKAFVADIKANGVREPVMLYQGAVLDGRNRHNAAHEAEIDFQTTDFTGDDNAAIDFVISKNIRRRHLTPGQCSALAVDLANMKLGDNQYRKEGFPNEKPSISLSVAVEKVPGATYGTAKRMASVKKADPAIFEEVKKGTITPGAAERKVKAAPKSNGHGKPVPKTTEPIRHYGDGTPKHLDIAKKLDPFFDALWLISADARENATKIENALAERNIIPVTDRKRDARKYLRDLKEKAPKKRNPERAAANAWLDMKDAWLALSGMEQDAFAEVYFKANDDLLRGLYVRTKALAERNRSANFAELAAFEANKTRDSGRQKGSIISDETTNLPAVVNDVSADSVLVKDNINDQVEEIVMNVLRTDEEFNALIAALDPEQAVEGDSKTDDHMAAVKIREAALRLGILPLGTEQLNTIRKALNVVLRRYGLSRKERRAEREATPETAA